MSWSGSLETPVVTVNDRLEVLFDELAELAGQRNAIDGRIVEIVAEIGGEHLWGATGCRSLAALVAWRLGVSSLNAQTITAIANRIGQFPRCTTALREGRLSLDQVGVIAGKAADGSDEHYAKLASVASVNQLRTAVKLEPRPDPAPRRPRPAEVVNTGSDDRHTTWRLRLDRLDAAKFEAGLASHREALMTDWKHTTDESGQRPPMPTATDAFMSLVEAGWDAEVARRPHGQHTTVIVHLDLEAPAAHLHLGPLLSDAERQYLTCDATCEAWFERDGRPIGAGRATRTINRRLRRALEYRHPTCAIPGCTATRGLHAHHIVHWEDGGPTELTNLVLVCPYHHRLHHSGGITITGPAETLHVTDADGHTLTDASLARPPTTPPPDVAPCRGPLGERADWWWYDPYQPQPPPPSDN